jgi:hypothetical protein
MAQPEKLLDIAELFSNAQAQIDQCGTPRHIAAMGRFTGICAMDGDYWHAMLIGIGCLPNSEPPEVFAKLFAIAYNMGSGKINVKVPMWVHKEDD